MLVSLAALHEQARADSERESGKCSAELHQELAEAMHGQDAEPDLRGSVP
jgi:hypothetical protein